MSPESPPPADEKPPVPAGEIERTNLQSLAAEQAAREERGVNAPRRPVACLFADLIGSTRIYDQFGDAVGRAAVKAQMDTCGPSIGLFGGRLLKTIGDALFAVFPTPAGAVAAADAMQRALAVYNAKKPAVPVCVRIGIHYGEAYVEPNDVFGDVVNTAARVVQLIDHPSIVITEAVWRLCDVSTQGHCIRLGEFELRGKRDKTAIHLFSWDGARLAPEEFVIDGRKIRRLTLDWEHPLLLRVVDGFLFGLGSQALACSHTTFSRHVQGIRHCYELEEGYDEKSPAPVLPYRRTLPGDPRICLVYTLDGFAGSSHGEKLDLLVEALAVQISRAGIRSLSFRMPHRLRGVDLQVGHRHAAMAWVRRLARESACRALDFVLRDETGREERADAVVQILSGAAEARAGGVCAVRGGIPRGWLSRGVGARELKRLAESGVSLTERENLGAVSTAPVTVWGEATVAYAVAERPGGAAARLGMDAT
ncbi:MAG: adenylate/guanylate cyclase domain-containing protein [Planctomycetes bacterium]|nr:adenylate/guanylate cyclase domain-containing protein [Planctomycetota bacterium]